VLAEECLQAEDGGGDGEVDDQPGGVAEGGDEGVGEYGGISPGLVGDERHDPADDCGHGADGQQGQPDDQADAGGEDEGGGDQAEGAEERAQGGSDAQLPPDHSG